MKEKRTPVHRFYSFAAVAWLTIAAQALAAEGTPAGSPSQPRPRATVEYLADEHGSLVTIRALDAPNLRCDVWCYEDQLGQPASHRLDGDALVLTHRLDQATVTSRFEPVDDGALIRVDVSGPTPESVKTVGSLNPCCQFRRSEAFQNRGHYVEDFVARCFVILEDGLTRLGDTRRVPGTRERENDKSNLPNPWIQEYFPIWQKHPGQIPGQRGYSLDRPVYPLIGCISHDEKHLAAIAWPESRSLGQVWHDCLHPRPAISRSYDPQANRTQSLGRMYFLPNDEPTLLAAFARDFPDWKRPTK